MTQWYDNIVSAIKTSLEAVFIKKSNTAGLVKNDGTIDTNSYLNSNQGVSNDGKILKVNSNGNIICESISNIESEHHRLHNTIRLYRFGNAVSLHIQGWNSTGFTSERDTYVQLTNDNNRVPEGWRPPRNIYIHDVVTDQHIVVGNDGWLHIKIGSGVPNGTTFNNQASWVVYTKDDDWS